MAPPKRPRSEPSQTGIVDLLDGDIPDPDAPASAAELARAHSFAALLDKAEQGRSPPALAADERALLEMATVIRATTAAPAPAPAHHALVEEVLLGALDPQARPPRVSAAFAAAGARRARPRGRWVPWALAASTALAAAAALALWLRPTRTVVLPAPRLPTTFTSRPADAVVGEISREAAADAARRIDAIYSDRLDGYRAAALFRTGGRP